ncbi:MGMT family protein [Candidatus Woesearchaeota archaeon]|nr:MGMT family protein [Candidatus Woesearchaeota archaeon]
MPSLFAEQVYAELRKVPWGRVTTYKELARAVGTKAYRSIGQVMRANPFAPEVPCHRVVASDGSIGGFGGEWRRGKKIDDKVSLLAKEGVVVNDGRVVDFERVLFRFR